MDPGIARALIAAAGLAGTLIVVLVGVSWRTGGQVSAMGQSIQTLIAALDELRAEFGRSKEAATNQRVDLAVAQRRIEEHDRRIEAQERRAQSTDPGIRLPPNGGG